MKKDAAKMRLLPSIDALLQTAAARKIVLQTGAKHLTALARVVLDDLRENLPHGAADVSRESLLANAENLLAELYQNEQNANLRRVINATGVVIHTNLGRAPLADAARQKLSEVVGGYCNLEYDIATGKRGKRGRRAEQLLAELTGAEGALIVNNCAAAVFLVLTVLARGGEAIISRGELVEIGGDFRIPDVMEQSGAILREVGATNRTKISDYAAAISENTKLILKVHPSNYRIIGFTAMPDLAELANLAHANEILLYEDAGSGAIFDLRRFGLIDEPVIADSIKAGADIVTFSGDKLLGAAQSGLIVGRGEIIERLRKHPLYRALRVDKMVYAALEATLEAFRRETILQEIPVLQMLALTAAEIETKTKKFVRRLKKDLKNDDLHYDIIKGNSVIGGGSAPSVQPATVLLALSHDKISATDFEEKLRLSQPPVITRILEDKVLLDWRTIFADDETELLKILTKI